MTRTVASDVKGAAQGIRDGLRHDPAKDPVDLNSASKADLQTLPDIGPTLAQRIIDARPYKKPSDLLQRRIVTKAVYDRIDQRLIVR